MTQTCQTSWHKQKVVPQQWSGENEGHWYPPPPSWKGLLTSCVYVPTYQTLYLKANNKEEGNGQNEGQYSFY